jgi:hypothetical protein
MGRETLPLLGVAATILSGGAAGPVWALVGKVVSTAICVYAHLEQPARAARSVAVE